MTEKKLKKLLCPLQHDTVQVIKMEKAFYISLCTTCNSRYITFDVESRPERFEDSSYYKEMIKKK